MVCCKWGSQTPWHVDSSVQYGYWWRCLRAISASACRASTSIRQGTRFQQNNLNFMDVLLLTYDTVHRVPAYNIQRVLQFGCATINEWDKLCRGVMLKYMLGSSQIIGGPNKTFEIDDSKFGRRKYNRGHKVNGQWVVLSASPEKVSSSLSRQYRRHVDGCSS